MGSMDGTIWRTEGQNEQAWKKQDTRAQEQTQDRARTKKRSKDKGTQKDEQVEIVKRSTPRAIVVSGCRLNTAEGTDESSIADDGPHHRNQDYYLRQNTHYHQGNNFNLDALMSTLSI